VNDAPALAAALNRLGDDTELRQTLGAQGRLRAAALFGRKRTIEVFKSLVETTVRTPDRLDGFLPDAELV